MRPVILGGIFLVLALGIYFTFIHSNDRFTRAGEKFNVPPPKTALDGEVSSLDRKKDEGDLEGEAIKRERSKLDRIPLLEFRVREGKGAGLLRGVRCYWIKKEERSIPNRLQKKRKIGETDKGGIVRIYHLKKDVEKWEILFLKKGFYSKSYGDFTGIKEGSISTRNVSLTRGKFGDCRIKAVDQLGRPISDVYVVISKKALPFFFKKYEITEIGSSKAGSLCKKTGPDGLVTFKDVPIGKYSSIIDKQGFLFEISGGIHVVQNGSKIHIAKGISFGIASFVVDPKSEILETWAMRLNHAPLFPTPAVLPFGMNYNFISTKIALKKNQKVFLVKQDGPKLGNRRGIIDWILVTVLFRRRGIVVNKQIPVFSFERFKKPTMITPDPVPSQGWVRFTPQVFSPDGEPIPEFPLKFAPLHPSRNSKIFGNFKVAFGKPHVLPVGEYRIFPSFDKVIKGAFHPTRFVSENLRDEVLKIQLDKKFFPVRFNVYDPYHRLLPKGTNILVAIEDRQKHVIKSYGTTGRPSAWLPPGHYRIKVLVGTYPKKVTKKFIVKDSPLTVPVHLVD